MLAGRTITRTLRLAGCLALAAQTALAQTLPPLGVLAELEGRWEGTGTILGLPSRVQMEWARALEARFVRLTFVSHIGPEPKARRFEGHAYYQPAGEARYRATWFDSSGLARPIAATSAAGTLVAAWGTPDTEEGETTYRLTASDRLEVVDRVKSKDGTWREFGRSALSRTLQRE
jgi:hypothetical protein